MGEELLKIRELDVRAEENQILHGVSLTIGRGDTHVLMGLVYRIPFSVTIESYGNSLYLLMPDVLLLPAVVAGNDIILFAYVKHTMYNTLFFTAYVQDKIIAFCRFLQLADFDDILLIPDHRLHADSFRHAEIKTMFLKFGKLFFTHLLPRFRAAVQSRFSHPARLRLPVQRIFLSWRQSVLPL